MTDNGLILKEILEMVKSGELPPRVSNVVLLAAIMQNTDKIVTVADKISTVAEKESKNESEIGTLRKLFAYLSALVMALLGWTVFG